MTCAVLLEILGCWSPVEAQSDQQNVLRASRTPEAGPRDSSLESQMQAVADEVRRLREENRELQGRVAELEEASATQAAAHLDKARLEIITPVPHPPSVS